MESHLNVDTLFCVHTQRFTNCISHGPWRKQMAHINKVTERNLIKEKQLLTKLLADWREASETVKHTLPATVWWSDCNAKA